MLQLLLLKDMFIEFFLGKDETMNICKENTFLPIMVTQRDAQKIGQMNILKFI